jgi:hypothetical protein
MINVSELAEAYHTIRQEAEALQKYTSLFEGQPWHCDGKMAVRYSADRTWQCRVYIVEGDYEVCVIHPDGTSETFA